MNSEKKIQHISKTNRALARPKTYSSIKCDDRITPTTKRNRNKSLEQLESVNIADTLCGSATDSLKTRFFKLSTNIFRFD